MTKITTADCKKFLVNFFKNNPAPIIDIYGNDYALEDSQIEKLWVRDSKCKPGGGNHEMSEYYVCDSSNKYSYRPATDFTVERIFRLNLDKYDTAVIFIVLEDVEGTLYLGDEVGD